VNAADGRKTAWVNDRRASGEVLRALSDTLVELHGQQDDRGLLDPRNHRAMLDDFGGLGPLRAEPCAAAWAERAIHPEGAGGGRGAAGGDAPRGGVPAPRRRRDRRARATAGGGGRARRAPPPDAGRREDARRRGPRGVGPVAEGAEGLIGDARRWLDGSDRPADGGLDAALAALERAMVELGEAQSEVAGFADRLVFNPAELEETEERLFALRGLARKHGVVPDDLERFGAELEARVAALDGGAEEIAACARRARTPWQPGARRQTG
jgi:DNA repair protein RecN (Recombination protein N)